MRSLLERQGFPRCRANSFLALVNYFSYGHIEPKQSSKASEVAVVGIPSDYWGEVILAAVENPAPGWEAIDAVVRAMTDYKRPRLLIALDELPRNGIGKILRSAIRADVLSRFRITEGPRPRLEKRDLVARCDL